MVNSGFLYNLLGTLRFFFMVFLFAGVVKSKDGLSILFNKKQYKQGKLQVKSLSGMAQGPHEADQTFYVIGTINDSITSTLLLGNSGTDYTDSIIARHVDNEPVLLPVWYHPNGKRTIKRYPNEQVFPFWRVLKKTMIIIAGFIIPYFAMWYWQIRLKKKHNIK